MWLAAENGMFLRHTKGEWMTTMPEHLNMEWVDSVKVLIIEVMYISVYHILQPLIRWCLCYIFSMFLSISLKERLDHNFKNVKLHLYGITSMQVIDLCSWFSFLS